MGQKSDKILGPDGEPASVGVPAIKLKELGALPFRLVDIRGIVEDQVQPKEAVVGTAQQMNDQASIILAGMYLLAKDVYSRTPEGSRHFQGFCESLGLTFNNLQGETTDPAKKLAEI